jgi:hypothetical protein
MAPKFNPIWLAVVGLLDATLVYAWASTSTPIGEAILVPWRAGNAAAFQSGAAEEHGRKAPRGNLPVRIYRPDGAGPFPFIVLLHGCGGLHREAMWSAWVEPWADVFRTRGVGTAWSTASARVASTKYALGTLPDGQYVAPTTHTAFVVGWRSNLTSTPRASP